MPRMSVPPSPPQGSLHAQVFAVPISTRGALAEPGIQLWPMQLT
jgi:hypothetical protein